MIIHNCLTPGIIMRPGCCCRGKPNPLNLVKSCSCEFWFDGQDAETLSLNGNKVIQWDDKSGFARHVSQAVDAQRPTWNPATGRVTFVTANSTYLTNNLIALTQSFTIYILCKNNDPASIGLKYFMDGITNRVAFRHIGGFWNLFFGAGVDTFATDGLDHIQAIEFNGAASQHWQDGIAFGAINPGANNLTDFVLGANVAFAGNCDGEIMEVFGYDCSLTIAERAALRTYLTSKWGL